jgi:putative DNA primase/helicase
MSATTVTNTTVEDWLPSDDPLDTDSFSTGTPPNATPGTPPVQQTQSRGFTANLETFIDRNEQGDAELFAQMFKGYAVYDHSESAWYLWRGQYWERDTRREIVSYVSNRIASLYIMTAAQELKQQGATPYYKKLIERGRQLQALTRVKHVLEFAAGENGISLAGSEWDTNPDLLPANNGAIDLKTGKLRNCKPTEHIRHHSPIDYKGIKEPCPLWENVLLGIFDGDKEMIKFIQRLFGYAITGHVTEHKLPIFLGESARNGKTTIFEALNNILGEDLSTSIPMNTFMKKKYIDNSPSPYLEKLNGKRLAYSSESAEGIKIDTALIKSLTGGDTLNPRGMYKDPKSFKPTHKLMLFTNYPPSVPPDDQAVWDRIMLIALEMRFVDNPTKPNERQKDKDLGEKLKAEYSGILAWLVRGCLAWRKQGLNPPAKVTAATDAYQNSEDVLQSFIDEKLIKSPGNFVMAGVLYQNYRNWCTGYGVTDIGMVKFGRKIKKKIGDSKRHPSGNGYCYENWKIV